MIRTNKAPFFFALADEMEAFFALLSSQLYFIYYKKYIKHHFSCFFLCHLTTYSYFCGVIPHNCCFSNVFEGYL